MGFLLAAAAFSYRQIFLPWHCRILIRCCLVHVVIQPIGIQGIGMGAPLKVWPDGTVILLVIILWNLDVQPLLLIPYVFRMEGNPVILWMSHHKNFLSGGIHNQIGSRLL